MTPMKVGVRLPDDTDEGGDRLPYDTDEGGRPSAG